MKSVLSAPGLLCVNADIYELGKETFQCAFIRNIPNMPAASGNCDMVVQF